MERKRKKVRKMREKERENEKYLRLTGMMTRDFGKQSQRPPAAELSRTQPSSGSPCSSGQTCCKPPGPWRAI